MNNAVKMNTVEIESHFQTGGATTDRRNFRSLSWRRLATNNFDQEAWVSTTDKSDLGGVLQTSNIHIKVCGSGEVESTLSTLRKVRPRQNQKPII